MNKKGFTLIELLAVIVILAIIAVITVPKIADMISSSRQGGAEDSFYGTLKAAELGYTKALQSNTNLKGSTCTITDSKITCTNGVKVDVSGKTPESGTLVIDSAGSTIAKGLTLNGYKCYGDLSTSNPCVKADIEVASETLIKKVTTTGDGLYKDNDEEGRYIFKGTDPSNYITFNGETWRIISTENDGTIKIMKTASIGRQYWDTAGSHDWTKASLNTYLNNTYYKSLNSLSKSQIQIHNFNIGKVIQNNSNLAQQIKAENSNVWNGNIALITASEYIRANADTTLCGNFHLSVANTQTCKNSNWIFKTIGPSAPWTLTAPESNSGLVFFITNGAGELFNNSAYPDSGTVPVLYLKSNLQITGSGTQSDPYKIK